MGNEYTPRPKGYYLFRQMSNGALFVDWWDGEYNRTMNNMKDLRPAVLICRLIEDEEYRYD